MATHFLWIVLCRTDGFDISQGQNMMLEASCNGEYYSFYFIFLLVVFMF